MDAAVSLSVWHLAVMLAVVGVLLNTALIVLIWSRQDTKRTQVGNLDTRVTVLEQRISGIGRMEIQVDDIREDLGKVSQNLSALNERSEATWDMVQSIQGFLRGS